MNELLILVFTYVPYFVSLFAFWLRVEHRLSVIETKISYLEKQYGTGNQR